MPGSARELNGKISATLLSQMQWLFRNPCARVGDQFPRKTRFVLKGAERLMFA